MGDGRGGGDDNSVPTHKNILGSALLKAISQMIKLSKVQSLHTTPGVGGGGWGGGA